MAALSMGSQLISADTGLLVPVGVALCDGVWVSADSIYRRYKQRGDVLLP